MKEFYIDTLQVKILMTRDEMGKVAAADIHAKMVELLQAKEQVNIIFAAAPSQNEVLARLVAYPDIDWTRINAYHMDEYIGLPAELSNRSFGKYLHDHVFGKVPFHSVNLIDASTKDFAGECDRYARLLQENPADIVVMGIGENGHIAFNDPWIADFQDKKLVKQVPLDEKCRKQQVNDGCFASLDMVPKYALTLTCPALFAGSHLFCVVPAKTKANAVKRTLMGPVSEECPATILRRHNSAKLYLDADSSRELR